MKQLAYSDTYKTALHNIAWALVCLDDPPLTRAYISRRRVWGDTTVRPHEAEAR